MVGFNDEAAPAPAAAAEREAGEYDSLAETLERAAEMLRRVGSGTRAERLEHRARTERAHARAIRHLRLVARARAIASDVHSAQVDADGRPHLDHVERVAELVDRRLPAASKLRERAITVALLHDTVEAQTGVSTASLRRQLGDPIVADAVGLLTHGAEVGYLEYVREIAQARGEAGAVARIVKAADLDDNICRYEHAADPGRVERYRRARAILGPADAPV
jgi:(p)ppGpp synthase/HD superfamily hydrolase